MAAAKRLIGISGELEERGRGLKFTVVTAQGETQPAFAVRANGQVFAYLNRCAHVPIEMDWDNGQFFDFSRQYLLCSTHGALYDPATGRCLGGRCNGRGLQALAVQEENNHIYLLEEDA